MKDEVRKVVINQTRFTHVVIFNLFVLSLVNSSVYFGFCEKKMYHKTQETCKFWLCSGIFVAFSLHKRHFYKINKEKRFLHRII